MQQSNDVTDPRLFNQIGLYLLIVGVAAFLLGLLNVVDDWGKLGREREHPAAVSWGILAFGLISGIYGVATIKARVPPCPHCQSTNQRKAPMSAKAAASFRVPVECIDCQTIWLTACPGWVPWVSLSVGGILLLLLVANLAMKAAEGSPSSPEHASGIAVLLPMTILALVFGVKMLPKEARAPLILSRKG